MSQLQKIIYLTREQYDKLQNNEAITAGGITLNSIDENNLYFITDETISSDELGDDFVLPVKNGGTGTTSLTPNSILGTGITSTTPFITITKATSITNNANTIPTTQAVYNDALLKSGGTMTGILTAKANQYTDAYSGSLNMNNSNIYGLNSIYTADVSENASEGIHFYRDGSHVDTLWMNGGNIYFVPNRAFGTSTTAANSEKVTRLPASINGSRVLYSDGTNGKIAESSVTSTELSYLSGVTSAIDTTYLKKSGGQMTGPLTWKDSNALPEATSLSYILGIDAFANGGTTKWIGIANLKTTLGSMPPTTHNHDASDINTGTLNTARLPDDVVKKRSGLTASTTEISLISLNPGIYNHTANPNNLLPTSYGTILNVRDSYKYGALIAAETNNVLYYRAYYYDTDDSWQWRGAWQTVAHATQSTNDIGSATQPIYMTSTGVLTAGTALKALAYKDSLAASDIPDLSWNKITSDIPTTLSGYGITNAVIYNGIDNDIGSSSTAANSKTYWANNTKVPKGKIVFNYNNSGTEYTTLFSNNNNKYGTILRWGYQEKYIRILRAHPTSGTYNGWYSEDWEKISAGYADAAPWSGISSKPTTISGYGITDAKIVSGVITLGSNTITPITSVNEHTGSSITITAGDLGLASALRFVGKTTSNISESFTGVPEGITDYTTPIVGDVVLDSNNDAEYVCIAKNGTTYTWELLGRSGSWATSGHTHGNITNGGLLTTASMAVVTDSNKKITTADLTVTDANASTAATTTFVQAVTQSAQGKITVTKAALDTSGPWSGNANTATAIETAGTVAQFYRGDNSWSNVLGDNTIKNTSFINTLTLYSHASTESPVTAYDTTKPSWGIGFQRKWNSTTEGGISAGIYAYGINGWKTGLIFRVKNNSTNTAAHDTTALQLNCNGAATFISTVTATKFIGPLEGNADSATKLATAREIYVDLATTRNANSNVTFDGTADISIHVSGTLPVTRGGTGLTTSTTVNAVVIGNSTTASDAFQTVATADGAFYSTGANTKPQFGKLPIAQGGTNATSFTDACVIVPSTTNSKQSLGSTGLKVDGAVGANIALSPNDTTKTMTISTTTGALTISTTNGALEAKSTGTGTVKLTGASGAMTISTTSGNIGIQTTNSGSTYGNITLSTTNGAFEAKSTGSGTVKLTGTSGAMTISTTTGTMTLSTTNGNMTAGPTGTGTLTVKTNSGAMTIQTTSGNMSLTSGGNLSITSASGKTTTISSGSSLTLNSATSTAINFQKNSTTAWSFSADGTNISPETSGAISLGTTSNRWGALYVGSANSYGNAYQPIYWNAGVPAVSYPVQYSTWSIDEDDNAATLTGTGIFTDHTYVISLVVTSGEENLNGPITWETTTDTLILKTAATSGVVSGYVLTAIGAATGIESTSSTITTNQEG